MPARSDLLRLIVCPACRAPLQLLSRCNQCGASFGEVDGTPSLIPNAVERVVSFRFESKRSFRPVDFHACFSYPKDCGGAGPGQPYHLDRAHQRVLEGLPKGSLVLEIGCGGGQMRTHVVALGHHYVGVDLSKTRVPAELQRHGGPDFLADAHFLPFADKSFDAVYSAALTQHLASPFLAVQEIARVLKPGGYYMGNVSFLEPWHDDSFFHMTPLGVFELLTQGNLLPIHIWPGKGYNGFRAIMSMGNKVTRPFRFLGDLMYFMYRSGNALRNMARPREGARIADAARVAGATDWIAQRPAA